MTLSAKWIKDDIQVTWDKPNGIEINEYSLERSINGTVFESVSPKWYGTAKKPTALDLNAIQIAAEAIYYRISYTTGKVTKYSGTVTLEKEGAANGFYFYPNPASDHITIELADVAGLSLIDLLGRTILEREIQNGYQLSVKDLPNGYYFIKMRFQDQRVKTVKVSVNH